ncbi:MAG: ABC transporter ATP-binding protein [Fimbriimonadaceae bacterium]|nr:ABC transporter ATP-binding protein [Fimbriimonadaceae bacterium]QYK59701.1 MAG: ABC transporter ATP-binding protein [Fimbriimonadaceae bacterium]
MSVVVRGVSKRFGRVPALDSVSVEFLPGEVHAVLGENGAGKSTLVQVLAGFIVPDEGSLEIDGEPFPLGDPVAARARGLAMVHQHFTLVPAFTVAENVALDRAGSLRGRLDLAEATSEARDRAAALGWEIDFEARAGDLPVGAQQRAEVLKALCGGARTIVLDEPTAVLSPEEADDLIRVVRGLAAEGKTVVLIAHKLSEVARAADRVTVLRRGRHVATALVSGTTTDQMAHWMVGDRDPVPVSASRAPGRPLLKAIGLRVWGDRGNEAVRGIDLDLAEGEVLGIGGVDGNGQVELAEALAGVRPFSGGLEVPGAARVGYIPQDRQTDGLALTMSVEDNLRIGHEGDPGLSVGRFWRPRAVRSWADALRERFDVRSAGATSLVGSLSGGNQQKVVVARVLSQRPDLLVAVNPTRGLDLKAVDFVHGQLREAARAGSGIVLISTDLDELEALADRTVFLQSGRLTDRLVGGAA